MDVCPSADGGTFSSWSRLRGTSGYAARVLHGRPVPPPQSLPRAVLGAAARTLAPPSHVLCGLHSGVVGGYVTWIAVGTAVPGGVWALLLHG